MFREVKNEKCCFRRLQTCGAGELTVSSPGEISSGTFLPKCQTFRVWNELRYRYRHAAFQRKSHDPTAHLKRVWRHAEPWLGENLALSFTFWPRSVPQSLFTGDASTARRNLLINELSAFCVCLFQIQTFLFMVLFFVRSKTISCSVLLISPKHCLC